MNIDLKSLSWVAGADGDGCGWMAIPLDASMPDGFWQVLDCEGDTLCVCKKETAVWLHMLLRKFDPTSDFAGYCSKIADEMAAGGAGSGGDWDEMEKANHPNRKP